MIYNPGRDGVIKDIDEYHTARDHALHNVREPPPSEADREQLKEAYADESPNYNYDRPNLNLLRRALAFWSDCLYDGDQLTLVLSAIVPSYNEFSAPETVEKLVSLLPGARWLPAREYSVCLYQFGDRALSESEQEALKIDEYSEVMPGVYRMWWD